MFNLFIIASTLFIPSIAAEIISKTQLNIHNEIDILHINNKLFNKYISTKIFDFKIKFFKLKSVLHKKIINSNKNTINLFDLKLNNLIMNNIDKYKNTLEKFKFGFKSYINSKYNAMIIKNNIIIKSIDDISNGKFKLILNFLFFYSEFCTECILQSYNNIIKIIGESSIWR